MCEYYLVPDLKNLQTFNNIKKSTTDQQLKNKFSHKTQNFKQFSHQMINQNNIQQTKKILPIVLNEKGTTNNFNQISPHLHQNSENNLINDQQHSNFIPQQIKITFLNSGNPPQTTPNAELVHVILLPNFFSLLIEENIFFASKVYKFNYFLKWLIKMF